MTDVATPPPAVETRPCPRCGAELQPDQEWCLSCGNAVATRIAPTPRWKLPLALVGTVLALLVAALVLSLIELGGDPQPVAQQTPQPAATPTPPAAAEGAATPTTVPQPGATPAPDATNGAPEAEGPEDAIPTPGETTPLPGVTEGEPTPGTTSPSSGGLASWPEGKSAWTVVIASTSSRADAQKKARAAGADAGILRSDDFSSLRKGYWVVFAGQYEDQKAAQAAAKGKGGDAYARRVVPR